MASSVLSAAAATIALLMTLNVSLRKNPPSPDEAAEDRSITEKAHISARHVKIRNTVFGKANNYTVTNGSLIVHPQQAHGSLNSTAALLSSVLLFVAAVIYINRDSPPAVAGSPPPVSDRDENSSLHVAVRTDYLRCGGTWATSKTPSELGNTVQPPIETWSEWPEWEAVADGAPLESGRIMATLQSNGDAAVTLTGMRVKVTREDPIRGTALSMPCGDPEYFRVVNIDLDRPTPAVTGLDVDPAADQAARERGWRTDPVRFPYTVNKHDPETFVITAMTKTCLCKWTAEIDWSSQGKTGTVKIDDRGKPFRVTADAHINSCTVSESVVCR